MTQIWSQLTGDPFAEDFFNLETSKSTRTSNTPIHLEAVMEVAATAKHNRNGVKTPSSFRPQKPKGLLEESCINVTEIARKGIFDPVIDEGTSVSSKFSTVEIRRT